MSIKSEPINLSEMASSNVNINEKLAQVQNQLPKGTVLFDKTLLPSRGKFYAEDIYVKKLTTLNIKNLASLDEKNLQGVINSVLQACVFGIDTNKILVGDKIWLIFYLRSFTYDDLPFRLRGECESCHTIASYEYHLNDLVVSYYDKDMPTEFKIGDDVVELKFPTIQSEADAVRLKSNDQIIEDIISDVLDFSTYIFKVNGRELSLLQAYKYVLDMDAFSFSKLTNILTEYVFTAQPYAKFKCPTCGEEVVLPISFIPQFFLPDIK